MTITATERFTAESRRCAGRNTPARRAPGRDDRNGERVKVTKKTLRNKMLRILQQQEEEYRRSKSRQIKRKLFGLRLFKRARHVMFYIALRGEVETDEMIRSARKLGKIVTVPVCAGDKATIKPCVYEESAAVKKGPYGVREPVADRLVPSDELDLVVVPGLAFDRAGRRLGRGKGCYDRFLGSLSARTESVGIAYDVQILPAVPTAPHDINVRRVISA